MTPEQQGLLATVIEEPDNDSPRLVYADWLEEHGQEQYAEFIRVQCQLAKTPLRHVEREPTVVSAFYGPRYWGATLSGMWYFVIQKVGSRYYSSPEKANAALSRALLLWTHRYLEDRA